MKESNKITLITGIICIALCVYVLIAGLINVIPALGMMSVQASGTLASVLFNQIFIPVLWIILVILMTIWVSKGKINTVKCSALLLAVHLIYFVSKLSGIISAPKSYMFTIVVSITLVIGLLCEILIHNNKTLCLTALGISYVVLAIMYVMNVIKALSVMDNWALAPAEGVILYIVKPIVLLVAIFLFCYLIFAKNEDSMV